MLGYSLATNSFHQLVTSKGEVAKSGNEILLFTKTKRAKIAIFYRKSDILSVCKWLSVFISCKRSIAENSFLLQARDYLPLVGLTAELR